MFSICVLNKNNKTKEEQSLDEVLPYALVLKTCLRELVVVKESDLSASPLSLKGYEVFSGFDAIEFLVKVLSGLESPVLGETEVLGQFKAQVLPQLQEKSDFSEVVQFTLNMVKLIRSKHLIGLGSQTYGSLVRKLLKGERQVLFVGAGQLTESILPWVKENKKVMISTRDPNKYEGKKTFKDVHFFSTEQSLNLDFPVNIVVCAPISSEQILYHIKNLKVKNIIDLREDSHSDSITKSEARVVGLKEAFSEMRLQEDRKFKILEAVSEDLKEGIYTKFTKHRPFGWDDLCI